MNDKVRIGGVWKRKTRDGRVYYAGKMNNNLKILVFEVNKKNENQPDLEIFFAPVEREEGQGDNNGTAADGTATVGNFPKPEVAAVAPAADGDGFPDEDA